MKPMEGARAALRLSGAVLSAVLRGIGWLFLVAVLLAGGLGTYAYRRFSSEDARRLAVDQLTALLHREVTIESLVIGPHGLKVLGLRVRRGRVGGTDDLLTCASALVTVKLRPLLSRRLEIDTVVLRSPQISLTRDAQGSWDLAELFGSAAPVGRASALPLALAAAQTVVENGVLRVDDRLRGRKLALEKLSLRVDVFDPDKPFPVEAAFTTSDSFGGRSATASVSVSGLVDLAGLNWSSATATVDRFRVQFDGLTLAGKASVADFSAPRVEAEIAASAAGPEQWRRLLGRETALSVPASRWTLKAEVPAAGMLDVERLAVQTTAASASATGVFDFAAAVPSLSVEVEASGLDLRALAGWSPELARYEPSGKAALRAEIAGWPGRLRVGEAELSLRDFGAARDGRRVEGADLDVSASEDFSKLKATASKGRVTAVGNVFDDVSGALTVDGRSIVVERLGLKWGGSQVRLRAKVGLQREKDLRLRLKDVVLSGSVDKVDWGAAAKLTADIRAAISTRAAEAAEEPRPWLSAFKYSIPYGFPDTTGHVRAGEVTAANFNCRDVELLWSLRGVTPALDTVSGEARLSFGPGRVADIPAVQDANKFLRVVFLPFVFMHKMNNLSVFSTATAYPKSLDFRRIDGEYGVSKGLETTRYFHVDSDQLVAYAEGSADFARERVDMNILTRLGSYRGSLPEWWVDEAGRPAIGFRVKGDLNKPDLEPRFKKIGEGEIEQKVDEGRVRAKKRFEALEKLQTF